MDNNEQSMHKIDALIDLIAEYIKDVPVDDTKYYREVYTSTGIIKFTSKDDYEFYVMMYKSTVEGQKRRSAQIDLRTNHNTE